MITNLISVIIPAYNSADFLQEALDSVLSQTYPNLEIIVVDDGSMDNTVEVIVPYVEAKKIIYLKKENGGPASARNLGIRKSTGEFIAFLDADDVWAAEKIEKQLPLFENPKIGLVFSRRFFLPENDLDSSVLFSGGVTQKLIVTNFITNSSVIMRRSTYDQAGPFREEKDFIAIEDYEFWLRVSLLCQFAYVDEGLVYYRIHANQISNSRFSLIVKNTIRLYWKMLLNPSYKKFKKILFIKLIKSFKDYLLCLLKH